MMIFIDQGVIPRFADTITLKKLTLSVKADSLAKLLEFTYTKDKVFKNKPLKFIVENLVEQAGLFDHQIEID